MKHILLSHREVTLIAVISAAYVIVVAGFGWKLMKSASRTHEEPL